jgi:DNA-binding PadR family transcriptional regulator
MTPFERAVLKILSSSHEPYGWYQIERRLSNQTLSERYPLPPVLQKLEEEGFIAAQRFSSEPVLRYAVTAAGQAALERDDVDSTR